MTKSLLHTSVDEIDREASEVWGRTGVFARRWGVRQPAAVVAAKSRARAARWRYENDQAKRPETSVIAMSLLRALVRLHDEESIQASLSVAEHNIVKSMIGELAGRGYDLEQIKVVTRRLRDRVLAEEAGRSS